MASGFDKVSRLGHLSGMSLVGGMVGAGDLAAAFGVDLKTVHNWERRGSIPAALRNPGQRGHRRWKANEAAKALRAHGREVPAGWESAS